jgi:hypothetical protein
MSHERGHKGSGAPAMLSVYSGRECIGYLIRRGKCGVEAFDINEVSLGTFARQFEAIEALTVDARKRSEHQP